jgi:hypothetical protein
MKDKQNILSFQTGQQYLYSHHGRANVPLNFCIDPLLLTT